MSANNVDGALIMDTAVENCLHWVMEMVFRDDECRVRTENAPANFTTLKHMAQNLIKKSPGKDSQRLKRKTAGWDDDFLASLIAAGSLHPIPLGLARIRQMMH